MNMYFLLWHIRAWRWKPLNGGSTVGLLLFPIFSSRTFLYILRKKLCFLIIDGSISHFIISPLNLNEIHFNCHVLFYSTKFFLAGFFVKNKKQRIFKKNHKFPNHFCYLFFPFSMFFNWFLARLCPVVLMKSKAIKFPFLLHMLFWYLPQILKNHSVGSWTRKWFCT